MSEVASPVSAPPRSTPAQALLPASLRGIPIFRSAASTWCREHGYRAGSADGGCWCCAALPAGPAAGGRFDAPAVTCCSADLPLVAAMERVGRFTVPDHPIPQAWAHAIHDQGHPASRRRAPRSRRAR